MDYIELDQFPVVPATGVATLVTDQLAGQSVHALVFVLGGTAYTRAHMDEIRIRCAGKDLLQTVSGAQLQDLNDYDGFNTDVAYVTHFFGDPTARTMQGQHLGDLDLSIYQAPLEIKVTNNGATAPTLKVIALVNPPKLDMNLGFSAVDAATVRAMIPTVIQPSAAVSKKSYGIGLGSSAGARLRKLGFFHANLTSVEMKKGGFVKHDNLSVADNAYIEGIFARVPQSGLYMLDRIPDGAQGKAETTLQKDGRPWSYQVNLTTSAGDTITAFADVHTALPLL